MSSTYLACKTPTLSCKIFPDAVVPFTLNCQGKRVGFSNLICKGLVNKNGLTLSGSSFLPLALEGNKDRNHPSILLAKFEDRDLEPKEEKDENKEDNRAMEAVLGLYSALKNNDVHGLADVLSEECQCMSNFIPGFKTLQGKQQVIEFFTALMGSLGENVQLIVKPTLRDGLGIGVAWKLECNNTHVPLGKGFGFHMCHEYEGKVLIRNVEMFMEPLFNMEPLRLKLIPLFTAAIMTIPGCTKLIKELSKANKGICVLKSPVNGHVLFLSQALPLLEHRHFPSSQSSASSAQRILYPYKGQVGAKAQIDSTKFREEHRICQSRHGRTGSSGWLNW